MQWGMHRSADEGTCRAAVHNRDQILCKANENRPDKGFGSCGLETMGGRVGSMKTYAEVKPLR